MAKVAFKTFREASLYSKNLSLAINSTFFIHRVRGGWWVEDTRFAYYIEIYKLGEKFAECTLCMKSVNFSLLLSRRSKKEYQISGLCKECQVGRNHCYSCKEPLDGSTHTHCNKCKKVICAYCGSCKCSFSKEFYCQLKFDKAV